MLANLGTLGSLSVAGPPEQVAATVRAMVYELGLGEHLSNAFVTTVGFTIGNAGQLDRVARRSEEEALQLAREAVERQERADHRLGPRELEVLVVRTEHTNLNAFLDLAGRRSGVALIVAGDVRSSRIGARFVLADDGSGRFPGVEAPLVASALTRPQEQELTRLLATAATPPAEQAGDAPAGRPMRSGSGYEPGGRPAGPGSPLALTTVQHPTVPSTATRCWSICWGTSAVRRIPSCGPTRWRWWPSWPSSPSGGRRRPRWRPPCGATGP